MALHGVAWCCGALFHQAVRICQNQSAELGVATLGASKKSSALAALSWSSNSKACGFCRFFIQLQKLHPINLYTSNVQPEIHIKFWGSSNKNDLQRYFHPASRVWPSLSTTVPKEPELGFLRMFPVVSRCLQNKFRCVSMLPLGDFNPCLTCVEIVNDPETQALGVQ